MLSSGGEGEVAFSKCCNTDAIFASQTVSETESTAAGRGEVASYCSNLLYKMEILSVSHGHGMKCCGWRKVLRVSPARAGSWQIELRAKSKFSVLR